LITYTIHHDQYALFQDGRTAFDVTRDSATAALLEEAQERLQQREKLLRNAHAVNGDSDEGDGAAKGTDSEVVDDDDVDDARSR
jgi:hypothetical protein